MNRPTGLAKLCAALALLAPTVAAQLPTPDEPTANPGRPTVSTPATLTPVGYLQFETGVLGATHSPEFSSRICPNELMKLSVMPRLELLAGGEPVSHFNASGHTANSVADIFVGAQAVLSPGEGVKPTVAVSYSHRAYDGGAPELDFGSPTNSFLLLASADLKGFHYDANAMLNELVQGNVHRPQFGQSLSISHAIKGKLSLSGRSGTSRSPFCVATPSGIFGP
jgi:hypothetical protein